MRLVQLYLDGFGHFNQRTFSLPDGKVAVFYGPNEAGKSTLLAFIRTVLFGFPARNRDSHFPLWPAVGTAAGFTCPQKAESPIPWSGTPAHGAGR